MRFIADAMLGRLARWLRLLGFDTLYVPHIEDDLLVRRAQEESRVLLTRDTRLVQRRGVGSFLLLRENDTFDQLKEVVSAFNLVPPTGVPRTSLLSRCSLCNGLLESIPKETVRDLVPEYTFQTTESFKRCHNCHHIYWWATHRERMLKKLSEVLPGIPWDRGNSL